MDFGKRLIVISLVLAGCLGVDRTTKAIAQARLSRHESHSFLGDTVRLQLANNKGAFLSLGASLPEFWRQMLFNGFTGVILLGLLGYALFSRTASPSVVFAIALFFAGGVSNLVDRLLYHGHVVDFLNMGIGPLRTGVFNLADVCIMAGAVILAVTASMEKKNSP